MTSFRTETRWRNYRCADVRHRVERDVEAELAAIGVAVTQSSPSVTVGIEGAGANGISDGSVPPPDGNPL